MDVRLYINGQEIEIDTNTIAPLTYSVADVKVPNKRLRNRSKTITIKGTKNNLSILFPAYRLSLTSENGSYSFVPNNELTARVTRNGVEVFDGVANYQGSTLKNGIWDFDFQIFGKSIGLFDQLGNMTLSDLDWSMYNHDLTISNIELSWDTSVEVDGTPTSNFTSGEPDGFGYIYGLVNFGYASNQLKPKTNELVPYFYLAEAFKKCFEVGGYTITGNWITSELIKKIVFGAAAGERVGLNSTQVQARLVHYSYSTSTNIRYDINPYIIQPIFGGTKRFFYTLNSNQIVGGSTLSASLVDDDNGQYSVTLKTVTIGETGNYNISAKLDASINLNWYGAVSNDNLLGVIIFTAYRNNSVISQKVGSLSEGTGISQVLNINIQSVLNSGDEIKFVVNNAVDPSTTCISSSSNPQVVYEYAVSGASFFKVEAIDEVLLEGDVVNVGKWLPAIKCKDFVNDIITMFNLYISEPNKDNEVLIETFSEYYTDTTDYDNWTEKQDYNRDVRVSTNAGIDGKVYKFHFAEDRDAYKQYYFNRWGIDYGDLDYSVSSTFKKGEKDYKIGFAQTIPIDVDGLIVPQIVKKDESTGIVEPHKGKPRIFIYNGLKSGSWELRNSTTGTATSQTYYPQFHHVDDVTTPTFDLNFGIPIEVYYTTSNYTNVNLFSEYYDVFLKELTSVDSKVLTAYFRLNELDVSGDFMKRLININGVLYRKNQILDFDATGNESTKVELIKVLEASKRKALTTPISGNEPPRVEDDGTLHVIEVIDNTTISDPSIDVIQVYNNSSKVTITLDTTIPNTSFTIIQTGTFNIVVQADSGTINGNAFISYTAQYESHQFILYNGVYTMI